jgi:hypothetical protein
MKRLQAARAQKAISGGPGCLPAAKTIGIPAIGEGAKP